MQQALAMNLNWTSQFYILKVKLLTLKIPNDFSHPDASIGSGIQTRAAFMLGNVTFFFFKSSVGNSFLTSPVFHGFTDPGLKAESHR